MSMASESLGGRPRTRAQLAAAGTAVATTARDEPAGSREPGAASAPSGHTSAQLAAGLTLSQRGELELAKARAERAASGRAQRATGNKRGRRSADVSQPNTDDDDNGDGEQSEGELELSRLSIEEQERLLSQRLASGGAGDKDARRLKRLLRNRVSAQQARERKKAYVSSLEEQLREQQAHIGRLEARVEAVEAQNEALRNIIKTLRGFADAPQPQPPAPGPQQEQQPQPGPAAPAAAGGARAQRDGPGRTAGLCTGGALAAGDAYQLETEGGGAHAAARAPPLLQQPRNQQQHHPPQDRNSRAQLLPIRATEATGGGIQPPASHAGTAAAAGPAVDAGEGQAGEAALVPSLDGETCGGAVPLMEVPECMLRPGY